MTAANLTNSTSSSAESKYTRCINDLLAQHVDLCVGDYWVTDERSRLVSFTTDIAIDYLLLFTAPEQRDSLSSVFFSNIFRPFDSMVWFTMICFFLVASVLVWIVESRPRGMSPEAMFETHKSFFPRPDGFLKALWSTANAYFSQGDIGSYFAVTAWPGRLVVLGLSFFVYIICASYTANLANYLTKVASRQNQAAVSSILDIRSLGGKVCVVNSLAAAFQNDPQFPLLSDDMQVVDDYGPLFEGLVAGRCLAAVAGEDERRIYVEGSAASYKVCLDATDPSGYSYCQNSSTPATVVNLADRNSGNFGKFCQLQRLVDSSFNEALSLAWPVADQMEPVISAWLVQRVLAGAEAKARQEQLLDLLPTVCDVSGSSSSSGNDVTVPSLGLTDMGGLYFYCVTVMSVGLWMHLIAMVRGKEKIHWPPAPKAVQRIVAVASNNSLHDTGLRRRRHTADDAELEHPSELEKGGGTVEAWWTLGHEDGATKPEDINDSADDARPADRKRKDSDQDSCDDEEVHGWFSCLGKTDGLEMQAQTQVELLRAALVDLDQHLETLSSTLAPAVQRAKSTISLPSPRSSSPKASVNGNKPWLHVPRIPFLETSHHGDPKDGAVGSSFHNGHHEGSGDRSKIGAKLSIDDAAAHCSNSREADRSPQIHTLLAPPPPGVPALLVAANPNDTATKCELVSLHQALADERKAMSTRNGAAPALPVDPPTEGDPRRVSESMPVDANKSKYGGRVSSTPIEQHARADGISPVATNGDNHGPNLIISEAGEAASDAHGHAMRIASGLKKAIGAVESSPMRNGCSPAVNGQHGRALGGQNGGHSDEEHWGPFQ